VKLLKIIKIDYKKYFYENFCYKIFFIFEDVSHTVRQFHLKHKILLSISRSKGIYKNFFSLSK